jgi:very-short-patch-repair endonuclease
VGGANRGRYLRKNATDAEHILWISLRLLKHQGLHFRRQAPIGRYTADFVCHRAKIVVELDGSQHSEAAQSAHDKARTAFLNSRGYHVMRFWNLDVIRNRDGIVDAIFLAASPPTRSACRAPTSPHGGGEGGDW